MSETLLPVASLNLPAPGVGINPWFFSHPDALAPAQGQAFNLLPRQDSFLAFLDCFTALSWFALKPLPVVVRINGKPADGWRINMMPVGDGSFYLYLHSNVRKASGEAVGDRVRLPSPARILSPAILGTIIFVELQKRHRKTLREIGKFSFARI
jgi:hypothetical protein